MRFSIWPSPMRPWSEILELTRHCEATGWDGVYFADHFMPNAEDATPADGDTLECWSVIAALAASVPRLRLAPLVTSVTYRHPAVLANIAAAVDNISGGRLLLGIGAGWQENEHAGYGLELGTVKQRLDRFEEACQVVTGLLREKRTTFDGTYYRLHDAPNQPPPAQDRLPLLIGGAGEKRTMRIAARYGDEWNSWMLPDEVEHKVGVLRKHCEDLGRDPAEIRVSTQALLFMSTDEAWVAGKREAGGGIVGTPTEVVDIVGRYRDAGADELIIPDFTLGPMPRRKETCDLFITEVASQLRELTSVSGPLASRLALVAAAVTAVVLAVAPVNRTETCSMSAAGATTCASTNESLVSREGVGVLAVLAVPIVVTVVPVVRPTRRAALAAAILLTVGAVLGLASIGLLFVPTVVLAWLAARGRHR